MENYGSLLKGRLRDFNVSQWSIDCRLTANRLQINRNLLATGWATSKAFARFQSRSLSCENGWGRLRSQPRTHQVELRIKHDNVVRQVLPKPYGEGGQEELNKWRQDKQTCDRPRPTQGLPGPSGPAVSKESEKSPKPDFRTLFGLF